MNGPVRRIEPKQVKVGQRVTLYPDGSHAFTVQRVLSQGWRLTFITETGLPVDVNDTDDLYLVE